MPQPIRTSIHLKYNPWSLTHKPDLCTRIVIITSLWSNIEDALARLFARVTGIEPAVAYALLGNVQSLLIRLQMLREAIDVFVSRKAAEDFRDGLLPRLRKAGSERNRVVHAHWRTHADYPEHLILTRGIGNPEGEFFLYNLHDFKEIEVRLDTLMRDVDGFDRYIQLGIVPRDADRRKFFSRIQDTLLDQDQLDDHPDQKTDP